ncbi:procathepsin L-like [Amphiura filiformis]|uniref:procathepsin L-like n=1 Tax=Amphiura filiformis TaxID=82378 RepID=UPI003B225EAE
MQSIILVLFTLAVAFAADPSLDESWEEWKTTHSKYYESQEEVLRRAVWEDNLATINKHNSEYSLGKHTFTLQMNHLGDLTNKEINIMLNGFQGATNRTAGRASLLSSLMKNLYVDLPDTVDWRPKGYVTEVKDQKQCGSCWAFSATGSLEGQHFKATGKLVSLSEQQLVDCSTKYGNHGCGGGLMDNAFRYIKANGGDDTEVCYPYEAKNDACRYQKNCEAATLTGFVDIPTGDEMSLKTAVANIGPISVAIDASKSTFHYYKTGVYNDPTCSSTKLDHGVLAVGYGTDPEGGDYWLVKNSWGGAWGEMGYIMMSRNKHNQCGIATQASYPTV